MRNVVVTGGSRGIGLSIATTLAREGYKVIAVARNAAATPDCVPEGSLHFMACDLTDSAQLSGLGKRIREAHGPIYGLVNNAGAGSAGMLATMPESVIERLIRLNVTAPLILTKYLMRPMMAAREGRIVNIASIVASTGYAGLSAYSATKAAMLGFTRSLARELGPLNITVNAVSPGFVETEMTHGMEDGDRARVARRSALKRMASAEDVAAAVGFLLGSGAANITGTVMTVDAGNTA